jgi:hypothetical protein
MKMKNTVALTAVCLLALCGCARKPDGLSEEARLPAGHFISWDRAQWVEWSRQVGFTTIQGRDDGLFCDLMGTTTNNRRLIVNFLPGGGLKDLMIAHITLDVSATGKLETVRSCLTMLDALDPHLCDSFAEIADRDRAAAFLMNTRKYPWRDTAYVIGITTANKFWMEISNQ